MEQLSCTCIPHAAWILRRPGSPPQGPLGLAAVRYYRFDRQVQVNTFRLHSTVIEGLYSQPEHVIISRLEAGVGWETVAEVHLPVIEEGGWHEVDLGGVVTDHLRVVCDREHPVIEDRRGDLHAFRWPWNVPFSILKQVEWLGESIETCPREPIYQPPLRGEDIRPAAPEGMVLTHGLHQVGFGSPYFAVAFSLRRPLITHLAWDVLGTGLVDRPLTCLDSRLDRRRYYDPKWPTDLVSGPWFSGLQDEASCLFWTGTVSVEGNRVIYRGLHASDWLTLDVEFEVFAEGMDVSIRQRADREMVAAEYEPWRFMWNGQEAITGTLALPVSDLGRTGLVSVPALWSAPGHGTMLIEQNDGDEVLLQVDSVRDERFAMSGIVLGADHDEYGLVQINQGESAATLSMRTYELLPRLREGVSKQDLPLGLRRNWPTAITFRPEFAGLSNNHMSLIAIMCNHIAVDSCAYTSESEGIPSVLKMAHYTTRLSLQGGPGYGENPDTFMDTDPSLLCAAGRIHQAQPDKKWLEQVKPWIKEAAQRILEKIDENGLYLCKKRSGNSGSGGWSSNAWDVISFGHYDAYSNALCYRALRNAAALMRDAGDADLAQKSSRAAEALKAAYYPCFFNPETGWLGGWRSRDGMLHDYAFIFINGMAICFGLIEGDQARAILQRLEDKCEEMGFRDFHYGLPTNLMSIPNVDLAVDQQGRRADGLDMFGIYLNGSLTSIFAEYYLGALSKCGLAETADLICEHLLESFADNRLVGGIFSGTELFTWEGAPCGYEGVLGRQFAVLLAIAQHRGWVEPFTPEWWPA